jgi:hypothetical protein
MMATHKREGAGADGYGLLPDEEARHTRQQAKTTTCDYCGKVLPMDPGEYYHKKACEAAFVREQIKQATRTLLLRGEDPADSGELKRLRARLEAAEYMGD